MRSRFFGYVVCLSALALAPLMAQPGSPLARARELYKRTEYAQALRMLETIKNPDTATVQLIGQTEYGMGDYKKATDVFEHAIDLAGRRADSKTNLQEFPKATANLSELYSWLGRAYGRRAETAFPLVAPRYAGKARDAFEKAVELDPNNHEALDDLFEYYLQAPGFLGGGVDKAEAMVKHIAELDAAWGQRALAQVTEQRKDYPAAEKHLRKAVELAPKQVGRFVDLAKYLAKRGRTQESDAMFAEAVKLSPNNPDVMFARARSYIEEKRNLKDARQLLQRYLASPLTPDNPSRQEAEDLLKKLDSTSASN